MEAVEERRFLNPRVHRSYRAVGVDVGGTKIACAIVSFEGLQPPVLSYHKEVPTEAALGGEHVMGTIIGVVRACLDEARAQEGDSFMDGVFGIGVGTAGCPDPHDGSIASANDIMPGWTGMPVAARLRYAFGLPASVMGDVQAHALGEARWGAARGVSSCLLVAPGTGLGGALVIAGRVLRGAHGIAGHIGHTLHPAARDMECQCGRFAHIESIASGQGIGALYQGVSAADPSFDEARGGAWVSAQAQAGDTRALQVLHDAGFALGESIASWVNILDPELVILAGSVCRAGAPWREALSAGYQSQALDSVAQTRIVDAALGGEAPLIGAAEDLLDSLELTGL